MFGSSFFSIIIPTFNSAETLGQCLKGISIQTFSDLEVIIQDGRSTDSTSEIARQFQAGGLNIHIASEADSGIYDAMNRGIARSSGKWIYFLGSDDELLSDHVLEHVHQLLINSPEKVAYGSVQIDGDPSWAKHNDIYDGQFSLEKLLTKNICHQAIFYNNEFLKSNIGAYNTNYRLCADWDFNLRCWSKTKFRFLNIVIAKFNAGGMTTHNSTDKAFDNDFVSNLDRYFKHAAPHVRQIIDRQISKLESIQNPPSLNRLHQYIAVFRRKFKV